MSKSKTYLNAEEAMKKDLAEREERTFANIGRFRRWLLGSYSESFKLGYQAGHIDGQLRMIQWCNNERKK